MNNVVITGLGVVSPVGSGRATFWRGLVEGRSGIGPITLFDASRFLVRIAGEIRDLAIDEISLQFPAARQQRDRKVILGLAAAAEAIADAGLDPIGLGAAQIHLGVSLEAFFLEDLTPAARAPDMAAAIIGSFKTKPGAAPLQVPLDTLARLLGEHYSIFGGRFTNCSACAAGSQAIGEAFRQIQDGAASLAIADGADSMLNPLGLGGFSLL